MDAAALIALLEQRDAELAALMQVITKLQKSINIKNKKIFGSTSEKLSVLSPEEYDKGYVPFEDVTKDAVEAAKEWRIYQHRSAGIRSPILGGRPFLTHLKEGRYISI